MLLPAQPTERSAARARAQVLAVACGVWHTAAVVVELEGPLAQAAQALTRAQSATSPLKGTLGLGEQQGAPDTPGAEASALSMGAHHRRNSSTSSALSEVGTWQGLGRHVLCWLGGGRGHTVLHAYVAALRNAVRMLRVMVVGFRQGP